MSFSVGDIVVPSSDYNASVVGVAPGTHMRVTADEGFGDTTVERESDGSNFGGWNTDRFMLASTPPVKVGDRVSINTTDANGATVRRGDLGTVTYINDHATQTSDSYFVKMDAPRAHTGLYSEKNGADYVFRVTDLTVIESAPEVETLESFKVKFLEGALERGRLNGTIHAAQVEKALERLAGLEYLDPSKTLEDFQKRVVALAMEKKAEHRWCGEPEAYLTEIGLAHLLPVTKTITLITTVTVSGPNTTDRDGWEALARTEAQRLVAEDSYNLWTPRRSYTVENDL